MPICSSGVSQPKFGVAQSMVIDQQYIQNLLPSGLAWLYPYLPWVHGLEIGSVPAFCAADPPSFTTPTAAQIYNFISQGPIGDFITVNQFIEDITKRYLWYQLCECASVSTPAAPSPPSAPANLPVVNPPNVTGLPAVGSCGHHVVPAAAFGAAGINQKYYDDQTVPPTTTSVTVVTNSSAAGATHPTVTMVLSWIGAHAPAVTPVLATTSYTISSGAIRTDTFPWPQGALGFLIQSNTPAGGSTDLLTLTIDYLCNGGVIGAPQPTPCPPDPAVRQLLKQIYELLTLVQRQAAPFAYIYGTNHTGLTGDGELAVSDLIGVSVDVTTLPTSYGSVPGTPAELYGLGFVSLGTADGWSKSQRIDHDGTLLLPPQAGVFTRVGYTLSPGIAVSIRELVKEP